MICQVCKQEHPLKIGDKWCDRSDMEIENDRLKAENSRYREALEFYASGKMFSSDPYCSVWEGWEYKNYDKRPIEAGQKAREALKEME